MRPTAETVAQVKSAGAAMGTQAKRTRSRAGTMEGFSIWIQRNWSEAQTPTRKLVSVQRRRESPARMMEGKEEGAAEEKKKAIWEAMSENQTPKKAAVLRRRRSRM